MKTHAATSDGLAAALGAYILWGFLPLYFKLLTHVPALEVLAQRVIWALPICIIIMVVRRQLAAYRTAFSDPRLLGIMALSAGLIGVNWLIYIYAIFTDHVLAASLGYYLNPLLNVVLATLFLKERLNTTQWLAVATAACGVAILMAGALETLWISLALAVTFALYGLVRKLAPIGALPGLAVETSLLWPPALIMAVYYLVAMPKSGFATDISTSLLLIAGGLATALPLLLFAVATRRMTYVALGFVQFLAPSIAFLLAIFAFNEPLDPLRLTCFILIWVSVSIFSFDTWHKYKANAQSRANLQPKS
jgi:chloramphenicol-sensitive protein RarD